MPLPRVRTGLVTALVTALALVLSACGGSDTPSTPSVNTLPTASPTEPESPPVEVTGLSDGIRVQVGEGEDGVSPGGGLTFVSQVYDIGPSGPLGETATVTMELDYAVPPGTRVLAASRDNDTESWTWSPATLGQDLQRAVFQTDRFSQFGIVSLDVSSAVETFKQSVQQRLLSAVDERVQRPACVGVKEVRRSGFTITSKGGRALTWCFGLEKGKPVLKVVNRLTLPVLVDQGDAVATATKSGVAGVWTSWLGLLAPGSDATFLAPRGAVTYDADIEGASEMVVGIQSSQAARSLRALSAGVTAITAQMKAYGVKTPTPVQLFQSLVAVDSCRTSLGKGSDALVAGCLSGPRLARFFGNDNQLLDPLLAPSMRRFWANRFAFLAEQESGTDAQTITVKRAATDFGALVGTFTGTTRSLVVSKDGKVVETLNNGSGPVIQLAYSLSLPEVDGKGAGRTTRATAMLTRVRVFDRSSINGPIPKVGGQGGINIRRGVVTPPFLQTTYCTKVALAGGACS